MEADHRFARVAQDPRFKASFEISCVVRLSLSSVYVLLLSGHKNYYALSRFKEK